MTFLNPNTRIAIGCYSGDHEQVIQSLDLYLHHECPVVIFSPENAKVQIDHPGVENLHAGKCARLGPDAHAHHLEYLKLLLTFPEDYFLMHEADSMCIDPKIPDYLYAEPDTFWSNSGEACPELCEIEAFPPGCPRLSFQAPWFLSRKAIKALVAASPRVISPSGMSGELPASKAHWIGLPWVDLYLVMLTHAAGLPYKVFRNCYNGFMASIEALSPTPPKNFSELQVAGGEAGFQNALKAVANGANMIHSVKDGITSHALVAEYQRYQARQPHA